ncbi:TetR/AcrR family transcriptional regulator [soil metagenome]
MATVVTRNAYFETGLEVLSALGYGGLKLAEVCNRLGVTTGSFYHYFDSWSVYTRDLVGDWFLALTVKRVEALRAEPDPRKRIDTIFEIGFHLPHGAESAIRSWSSVDPRVRAVQVEVDRARVGVLTESAFEILGDHRLAQLFAHWALYLLVGYEQSTLPPDTDGLAWMVAQQLDALDSGRFSSLPESTRWLYG